MVFAQLLLSYLSAATEDREQRSNMMLYRSLQFSFSNAKLRQQFPQGALYCSVENLQ